MFYPVASSSCKRTKTTCYNTASQLVKPGQLLSHQLLFIEKLQNRARKEQTPPKALWPLPPPPSSPELLPSGPPEMPEPARTALESEYAYAPMP